MKARRVKHLDPGDSLAENAERIVRVRLEELCDFVPAVLDPSAVRELHDMRIAAKRLRYALEVHGGPVLRPVRAHGRQARQGAAGPARRDPRLRRAAAARRGARRELRDEDAAELRRRAGDAPDLDPALAARLPHSDSWRGLIALETYLRARRDLLYERFTTFWRDLEREGFRARLEYAIAERPEPEPEPVPRVTLPPVDARDRARPRPAGAEHRRRPAEARSAR